jgi:hypothetical protein
VPLEALGIEGGHLVSLDMSPSEFAAAPTWRDTDAPSLPNDAIVRVALSRFYVTEAPQIPDQITKRRRSKYLQLTVKRFPKINAGDRSP